VGEHITVKVRIELIPMFQDYDLIAAWKLRRLVRKTRPDIVHTHHATAHAVTLLALSFTDRPPLIVSRRVSFSPRRNPFSRWKYRSARIDRYVVVSRSVMDTLVRGGVDREKIRVVYSAVNPDEFKVDPSDSLRRELGIPEDAPLVGKLANYSRWKGQHIFLEAAKRCAESDPKMAFILVGKETEKLASEVERLGLTGRVHLLGFRKDVPRILAALDVSVNSAIEGEGLSGAMRESLLLGIPVVASDVSGNREVVRDGETGFLVPVGDAPALAEKISFVLKHAPEAKALAQRGREWVLQNATVEPMVRNMLDLYGSLAPGR
jgi:glycosyltransferase involved in cell wall biosynthesis